MSELKICLMHIAQGHYTNFWAAIETETYSEHYKTFKMDRFAKAMPECKCAIRIFSGQRGRGFVELGYFDKHSSKAQEKEALQGNILEVFLLDALKTTFWIVNLSQRWTQSGPFIPKSGHFFWFQKRQRRPPLSPLVTRLWVWLNVHQYPWICLNIHENARTNCSHYVRALNMHEHLTCSKGFWKCLGF